MLKLKRVYEPPEPTDGKRILVDRLWPRGRSKRAAAVDRWLRDLGPSDALRKWFGHDPERWPEFRRRYRAELRSQHAVLAFTLFSSLLDARFRTALAQQMWQWVAPGGGVLVYDFVVNNPRNSDVQGMPLAEVRRLFPQARLHSRRITLAPPVARRLPRSLVAPCASLLPFLRTHRLTWAVKPAQPS